MAWVWERIPGEIFDNVGGTNSPPATHDQLVLGQNGSILNFPTHAGGGGGGWSAEVKRNNNNDNNNNNM